MKETYLSRDFRETAAQCFPSQAKELNAFFDAQLNVLLAENADASKEKLYHLKQQILPGIAVYETLQRVMPKEEALQTVHGYVEELARTSHKQRATLLLIPGLYRLVPGVFVKSTRSVFGPAAGFDSKELQVGNGIWRVDMMKCPYGYIKDPNDPKHWIVDDEAAQVVRCVYSMTLEGFGTEQIAAQLEKDDVLTPRGYWLTKGIKRPGKGKQQPPTKWNNSTITKILSPQEYCGDILNFKTYSKSYKNKKQIDNDRENWVVFQDVHEAIIERAVYEQVQQKRGKIRKRRTNNGEHNMFSGLLVCADCGSNLHFHFNQGNPEIKYFNCSNYKGNRGTCTSTHYVRVDFLEEVVLGEIRRLTKFASLYEDEFVKAVIGHSQQAEQTDRKLKEKELRTLLARDEELDGLFERIYEDNVSGKLSDDRFAKMSRRYEDEQKELAEKIKKLRSEIEKQSSRSMTTDMFIGLVRKYTRARKLTPRMLNELIEKIEVFNAEKIDGVWEQRLRIHYNCVGTIEIPTVLPLPIPEVSVNTRKGVVVNYAPCELAV